MSASLPMLPCCRAGSRVSQALDYVAGVHPRFDRAKAEGFLAKTTIRRASRVRELSKGMVTQLHLALVMAIDARLLVLDEPTLGLDILYRKQFYDSLLNDYFDRNRTIVVATHQVEEVAARAHRSHVHRPRPHRIQSQHGRIGVALSGSDGASREGRGGTGAQADARAPGDRSQHPAVRSEADVASDRQQLAALGDVRTPSIADLFVAVMGASQPIEPGTRSGSMNTQSNAMPESFDSQSVCSVAMPATRRHVLVDATRIVGEPFDLHRAAGGRWRRSVRLLAELDLRASGKRRCGSNPAATARRHYDMAAGLMMLTGIVVSVFYCLDALHGERRDRSILFWKSLPVSDLTTVLAKASIPLVILPLLTFAITVAMQWIMLLLSSVVLLVSGLSVATLVDEFIVLPDVVAACSITCSRPMRSGPRQSIAGCCWCPDGRGARHFYGRILPLVAIGGVEQIAFHTWHFAAMVGGRLIGAAPTSPRHRAVSSPSNPMTHIAPDDFLSSPGSVDRPGTRRGLPGSSGAAAPLSRTHLSRVHHHSIPGYEECALTVQKSDRRDRPVDCRLTVSQTWSESQETAEPSRRARTHAGRPFAA